MNKDLSLQKNDWKMETLFKILAFEKIQLFIWYFGFDE
jgi:hypothetical protein